MLSSEHYKEAERLLEKAKSRPGVAMPNTIAAAQAHATLALVAATVKNDARWTHGDDDA